jgi:hypothetical protein
MAKKGIKLGDEIEDVTSKASGIAIGKITYLSGAIKWIVQPITTDDNIRIDAIYVEDAYAIKISEGVHPKPQKVTGFHARDSKAG